METPTATTLSEAFNYVKQKITFKDPDYLMLESDCSTQDVKMLRLMYILICMQKSFHRIDYGTQAKLASLFLTNKDDLHITKLHYRQTVLIMMVSLIKIAEILNISVEEFEEIKIPVALNRHQIGPAYQLMMTEIATECMSLYSASHLDEANLRVTLRIVWGSLLCRFEKENLLMPYEFLPEVIGHFSTK